MQDLQGKIHTKTNEGRREIDFEHYSPMSRVMIAGSNSTQMPLQNFPSIHLKQEELENLKSWHNNTIWLFNIAMENPLQMVV